jgi:hypothetical protein
MNLIGGTMALVLTAADSVIATLGIDRSRNVPDRALDGYSEVASALPGLWPCTPDEQRVRYYAWASRQVREAKVAITAAMELLDHVAFWTNVLGEQLEDFARTGTVPDVDDDDLEPVAGDPVQRILAASRAMSSLDHSRPMPSNVVAITPRHAALPPSLRRRKSCHHCGTALIRPKTNQRYCSPTCREAFWSAANTEAT